MVVHQSSQPEKTSDNDNKQKTTTARDTSRVKTRSSSLSLIPRGAKKQKTHPDSHAFSYHYNMDDNSNEPELTPHKQLLMDAAAEIRNDQLAREKSRPQNVGEGTLRLLGDSLGGVALGAAAVVMGPVQGYKHPNDPEATERFQKISNAYQ